MNKLEYDSLYKFLVSFGIILIVLPIAALIYLLNGDPILISQADFDELSVFSQQMIEYRNSLTSYFVGIFPWFAGIFILIGVLFLGYGIYKWGAVQRNLDKKLDAETTMQTLNLMKMSSKEVEAKVETEVKEDISAETIDDTAQSTVDTQLSRINKYKEIENLCFNYFKARYSRNYRFKRNIHMGKYDYDFIGVSQTDNIDVIVEVKYYRTVAAISKRLYDFFEHFYDAGVNYETIAHRNFECVVAIVTSKDQLPQLEKIVETYLQRTHPENVNKIEIKCIAEEAL